MSVDDTKRKVISFRLSCSEYDDVEAMSQLHGFDSVALFARSATLMSNPSESIYTTLHVEVNRVWHRLESLTTAFEHAVAQLRIAADRMRQADRTVEAVDRHTSPVIIKSL
jgi:hypothetical protein